MARIEFNELTHDDEGVVFHQGVPFTGTAIDHWPNGQLGTEEEYVKGIQEGLSRGWHDNGVLSAETFYRHGCAEGTAREWHRNGQLRLEEEIEEGFCLRRQEWDERGNPVKEYVLTEGHPHYERLLSARRRRAQGVDGGTGPASK